MLKWGYFDFMFPVLGGMYLVFPYCNFLLLPALIRLCSIPRRWIIQRHFCWHAELIPHTEQVVFHKSGLFGNVDKYIVDIKNLDKAPADIISNELMWKSNMFDKEMVFRDSQSSELFVFDKQGIWN